MQDRILNIPNILTLARIIITPFIVYAILEREAVMALLLMGIAGITDMLDGAIARLLNQRSTVGAFMDPLADKLMLISTIVALYFLGHIPTFLFLAVVFRDMVIILGATAYEMVTHKLEMTPLFTSKITTFLQIMLVLCVLADMAWQQPGVMVLELVTWFTFAFTCISGLQYMVLWMQKAVRAEKP
ncbi:CDP-alcohol phosphatidyltransferase family protein [Mariprofundus erugo]|uniref:CDP-diacylglycerol--glycerol-3-phosphate 3-phosphatidyltransferase n=1 Tax=Mariprofundus erugo TaxID=2528639 RepID=A0A5R9GYD6_9PROT|nr:CDP-alcohol phosphatidyltransferase family protein [Mariprofundus erugo]TLS68802.1 CDP-alcohol phosphatidyltransferase family protein [Mariprofundus erugo]TLS77619.1 CDP-alcohol phosphatidyltransferase family protein [Mariprofundus erugo]